MDRELNRLTAENEEEHQLQAGKLKEALQLVLLNRKATIKKAKEAHVLSPSACTLFDRCLRPIKRKLVRLLGDKELNENVVEDIKTRRQTA